MSALPYMLVGIGSAAGGIARYACTLAVARTFGADLPWGTFAVNVAGSLLVGLLAALAGPDGRPLLGDSARLLLMVGFLGGFTTFSAFSLQTLELLWSGRPLWAAANVLASVVLCTLAAGLGWGIGRSVTG